MPTTYEAVLRGNLIEWGENAPRHLAPDEAVHVRVTLPDESASMEKQRGQHMAAVLEKLAQAGTFAGVDAARWERETRAERPLPGRGE